MPSHQDKLYTLAFFGPLLMATVPYGASADEIEKAVRDECIKARVDFEEPTIIEGVHFTDEPRETDEIVYEGSSLGWLLDAHGTAYQYAVKR